jgi:hypothetical protein
VIIVTGLAVAGLCAVFALVGWNDANALAAVASAVTGVAAVGATVWAAMREPSKEAPTTRVRAARTGEATARAAGTANTGIRGPAFDGLDVVAEDTGIAVATGEGEANTGVRLT